MCQKFMVLFNNLNHCGSLALLGNTSVGGRLYTITIHTVERYCPSEQRGDNFTFNTPKETVKGSPMDVRHR